MYLSFHLKSILSVRLSDSLRGSDLLLISEFINKVSIFLLYSIHFFIVFVILLYTFYGISYDRYKKYIICLILFSKFSEVSSAFTCARAIDNL